MALEDGISGHKRARGGDKCCDIGVLLHLGL